MAYSASSRRSETPSLSKMLCKWFLTVCSEMKSFSPISLLRKPCATSCTISFSVAEQRLFAARAGFRRLRKCLHDLSSHALIEPDFAGMHAMNAFHQEIGGGLLQHHAARAETHGANNVAIVFCRRQNDDARGKRIEIDFLEHGQAILIRHAQVEEENVRLELGEELDALRAVLGFPDDGYIFVGIEKFPQAIAKDRVVIG